MSHADSAENFLGLTQTAQTYTDWRVAAPSLLRLKALGISPTALSLFKGDADVKGASVATAEALAS